MTRSTTKLEPTRSVDRSCTSGSEGGLNFSELHTEATYLDHLVIAAQVHQLGNGLTLFGDL